MSRAKSRSQVRPPRGRTPEKQAAIGRDISPAPGSPLRHAVLAQALAIARVEPETARFVRHKKTFPVGGEIAAVMGDEFPDDLREVPAPELEAIVGVIRRDRILGLDEEDAIRREWSGGAAVATDHLQRPGPPEPQEPQRAMQGRVSAARRVSRIGIGVRPIAGARQGPAPIQHPFAAREHRGAGELPLRQQRPRGSRPAAAKHDHAPARFQHARHLAGIDGSHLPAQQTLAHDQVGEVVREWQRARIGSIHGDPGTQESLGPEQGTRPRNARRLRIDHADAQLRAPGKFRGESTRLRSEHQGIAAGHARLPDDGLRRVGADLAPGGIRRDGRSRRRVLHGPRDLAPPRAKTVDRARRRADEEPAIRHGQPARQPIDRRLPEHLPLPRIDRDHPTIAAGEERVPGHDERLGAFARQLPELGRTHRLARLVPGRVEFRAALAQALHLPPRIIELPPGELDLPLEGRPPGVLPSHLFERPLIRREGLGDLDLGALRRAALDRELPHLLAQGEPLDARRGVALPVEGRDRPVGRQIKYAVPHHQLASAQPRRLLFLVRPVRDDLLGARV